MIMKLLHLFLCALLVGPSSLYAGDPEKESQTENKTQEKTKANFLEGKIKKISFEFIRRAEEVTSLSESAIEITINDNEKIMFRESEVIPNVLVQFGKALKTAPVDNHLTFRAVLHSFEMGRKFESAPLMCDVPYYDDNNKALKKVRFSMEHDLNQGFYLACKAIRSEGAGLKIVDRTSFIDSKEKLTKAAIKLKSSPVGSYFIRPASTNRPGEYTLEYRDKSGVSKVRILETPTGYYKQNVESKVNTYIGDSFRVALGKLGISSCNTKVSGHGHFVSADQEAEKEASLPIDSYMIRAASTGASDAYTLVVNRNNLHVKLRFIENENGYFLQNFQTNEKGGNIGETFEAVLDYMKIPYSSPVWINGL
jgi:hypothetical protein